MTNTENNKSNISTIPYIPRLIASITRHVRFPGREKFLYRFFPPEHFRSKNKIKILQYDNTLRIQCDLGSFIEWNIFFKGYYIPDQSRVIKKLIKKGMYVIDVGANIGAYTLLMAKSVGSSGKVLAIEPNPETFSRLVDNVKINKLEERVTTLPVAVSNKPGKGTLFVPKETHPNRGIASLQRHTSILTLNVDVEIYTLDKIWQDSKLQSVDFIKVDTDGSDISVLLSGENILRRYKPILIFEFDKNFYNKSYLQKSTHELLIILKELGYKFFGIRPIGRLIPLYENTLSEGNIVCLPKTSK